VTSIERVDPLFATPVVTLAVDDADTLNATLLYEIARLRATGGGTTRSNRGGWHSDDDLFTRPEPGLTRLRIQLIAAIGRATLAIAPGFDLDAHAVQCEGWINVNGPGAFNTPHDHPGWTWSGVYYVSVPPADPDDPKAGTIEFLDPRTNVRTLSVDGADCFAPKVVMTPRAGRILLFPSWLTHWVYPHDDAGDRVSIAFNARFGRLR